MAFYDKYTTGHPETYGIKFDFNAEIEANIGNVSVAETMRRLDEINLITKNCMRVDVVFEFQLSLEFAETPAITVDVMPAHVDGAMTLHLNISFMFIVDIIDLLYNIIYNDMFSTYCRKNTSSLAKVG